jgi:hypothetical protein
MEADPLTRSVQNLISRVCDLEDACGGKFTIETETTIGIDYLHLEIRGVDELNVKDMLQLTEGSEHIVAFVCNLTKQHLEFRFEMSHRKKRVAEEEIQSSDEAVKKQFAIVKNLVHSDTEDEDVMTVCKYILAIKDSLPVMQMHLVKFDFTTIPGVIMITVKGIQRIEKHLFLRLKKIIDDTQSDITIFLAERQCLRICVKKRKHTVNV